MQEYAICFISVDLNFDDSYHREERTDECTARI